MMKYTLGELQTAHITTTLRDVVTEPVAVELLDASATNDRIIGAMNASIEFCLGIDTSIPMAHRPSLNLQQSIDCYVLSMQLGK